LPEDQRNLPRIVWVQNDDLNNGSVLPYRFKVHLGGLKSSPYIACFAIQKTLEKNVTIADQLTIETIRQNIYMDELVFSVDSLEQAQLVAKEADELFKSQGFNLVKWNSNREALPVLSNFDKPSLSTGMHNIDLASEVLDLPSTKTLG